MERILLVVVLVATSCLADAARDTLEIARRGEKPAFRVVVEKNASPAATWFVGTIGIPKCVITCIPSSKVATLMFFL